MIVGAGGSFVLAMRWVHDLDAFNRLKVADQEGVIGRTKADSVEIPDAIQGGRCISHACR